MMFHISTSIDGLLALKDKDLLGICACGKDENGNHPTVRELRAFLLKEKTLGHRLIPAEGCDNFDPVKGCMGHDIANVTKGMNS